MVDGRKVNSHRIVCPTGEGVDDDGRPVVDEKLRPVEFCWEEDEGLTKSGPLIAVVVGLIW